MQKRRRVEQMQSLENRLTHEAERLRAEARRMRPCLEREQLIRKAQQTETAARVSDWLRSPGLRKPD